METPNYKCTQSELYTIATLGWQSASQHLPAFNALKAKYDPAYVTDRISDLAHAKSMPTLAERNATTSELKMKLINANRICLYNFQSLKRYISDAYEPELWNIEYNAAGQQDYEDARRNNWDSTEKVLDIAKNYIQNRIAVLTANQNMPASFQATFLADAANFSTTHTDFLNSEETAVIGTEEKLKINNMVYADMMSMFADGIHLFRNEDAIKKQFTFTELLYLASGAGTAGVRGLITDINTSLPILNALVTVVETNEADNSNEEGKYQISPMAAGVYTLRIIADNYQEKLIPQHEVSIGTISSLNIHLLPIV